LPLQVVSRRIWYARRPAQRLVDRAQAALDLVQRPRAATRVRLAGMGAHAQQDSVDRHFLDAVREMSPAIEPPQVDPDALTALFDSQAGSRHLDLMARQLGKQGLGYYSIGSSGHESNAAVA